MKYEPELNCELLHVTKDRREGWSLLKRFVHDQDLMVGKHAIVFSREDLVGASRAAQSLTVQGHHL